MPVNYLGLCDLGMWQGRSSPLRFLRDRTPTGTVARCARSCRWRMTSVGHAAPRSCRGPVEAGACLFLAAQPAVRAWPPFWNGRYHARIHRRYRPFRPRLYRHQSGGSRSEGWPLGLA